MEELLNSALETDKNLCIIDETLTEDEEDKEYEEKIKILAVMIHKYNEQKPDRYNIETISEKYDINKEKLEDEYKKIDPETNEYYKMRYKELKELLMI